MAFKPTMFSFFLMFSPENKLCFNMAFKTADNASKYILQISFLTHL